MEKTELKCGDVLQFRPEHKWGGMLVVVTEPKGWGCQGYLMSAYEFQAVRWKGRAFVRAQFEDVEFVGSLCWQQVEDFIEGNDE